MIDAPTDDEVMTDFLNMGAMSDQDNAETLDRWNAWLAAHDAEVAARTIERLIEEADERSEHKAPYSVFWVWCREWLTKHVLEIRKANS